jgi:hypothetical protein
LRNRFAGFGPDVRDYLSRLETDEQIHCSPIEWIEQPNWHTRRIVLIGDAAHARTRRKSTGGYGFVRVVICCRLELQALPTGSGGQESGCFP